jgi:nucleoside-diphosphate kinase
MNSNVVTMGSNAHNVIEREVPYESTFALIKSHVAYDPRVLGDVWETLCHNGIEMAAVKRTSLTVAQVEQLYAEHIGRLYYQDLVESVSGGVVCMALRGRGVIAQWRRLIGVTNSMMAEPGTLRAKYGSRQIVAENVAHGSDSIASARRELAIFFPQQLQLWTAG